MSLWDAPGIAASVESEWESPDEIALRLEVAQWIGPGTGRFLDLGCGTARMAPLLMTQGWRYKGVDGSREMLRIARTRVKTGRLLRCDFTLEPLPFRDGHFDAALCMQVFRHLATYEPVLRELARVTRGRVFVQDVFYGGKDHIYGTGQYGGQTFHENSWSLERFVADAQRYCPGRVVSTRILRGTWVGVEIGSLQGEKRE